MTFIMIQSESRPTAFGLGKIIERYSLRGLHTIFACTIAVLLRSTIEGTEIRCGMITTASVMWVIATGVCNPRSSCATKPFVDSPLSLLVPFGQPHPSRPKVRLGACFGWWPRSLRQWVFRSRKSLQCWTELTPTTC
jgi:hypothetical protein